MSAPMTSERCARLLADTKRILDLVEGPWTVPDRRDMEALSRIVQDVPALLDEVERLRAELALWENTRPYVAWLRKAKAERDEARTEAGQLRAMYDDLCKSMSQTGDRLATAERERDEAREQVRVLAGLLKRGNPKVFCAQHPNHAEPGCEVCRDAEIFRAALDGTEDGQ